MALNNQPVNLAALSPEADLPASGAPQDASVNVPPKSTSAPKQAKANKLAAGEQQSKHPDPDEVYNRFESRLREERPWEDFALLRKAYEYAKKHHEGQKRESG